MFAAIKIKLLLGLLLSCFVAGAFYYVKMLQAEVEAGKLRESKYQEAIQAKDEETSSIRADIDKIIKSQQAINKKLQDAQVSVTNLEKKFTQTSSGKERDLGKDALAKPELIEKAINNGTVSALRCNEVSTGSPLTDDEKLGKTVNTICPELFPKVEKK